jgi:NAD(P)-dependent dehydrogenase (short-subunit alcohol dehydrogenase family)
VCRGWKLSIDPTHEKWSVTMANLIGKTALVTGASRGIGRAIAGRLAADGALVAVHYGSNDAAAKETVAAIEQAGGQAFTVQAQLGVPGDVATLFAGLADGLQGRPLDILVNNAAIGAQDSVEQTSPELFDRLFAVNVRAPFFIIQKALPLMPDGARIINVSSSVSRVAMPEVAYAMTKGAVDVLSRTLANAVGTRAITVNAVAPGVTDTDMNAWMRDMPEAAAGVAGATALGRIGQPRDVADVVAFLASDDARWVTGHLLDATGGLFLGPRI